LLAGGADAQASFHPERIVDLLKEAEVLLSRPQSPGAVCRRLSLEE